MDIKSINEEIARLEEEMTSLSFWENKEKAQESIRLLKELKMKKEGGSALSSGNAILSVISGAGGDDS